MKKIILAILLSFISTYAFAKNILIKPSAAHFQETFQWEFNQQDNGRFFLLGPDSDHYLVIRVNKYVSNGLAADPIVVNCNGKRNQIMANQSLTCYGNFANVISMHIDPPDFKNGSAGTYTFVPLTK